MLSSRYASRDQLRGFSLLGLAALSLGLHIWFVASALILASTSEDADYLFVSANFRTFAASTLLGVLLVFGGHGLVRRAAIRTGGGCTASPESFSVADVAWARPLLLFAVSLLALGNLVPWLANVMSVLSHVVVDLRWWWTSVIVFWLLAGIDRRLNGMMRAWIGRVVPASSIPVRRFVLGMTVMTITAGWAMVGTPHLRFSSVLHGDEPRYVRYCEMFYRGTGFELSRYSRDRAAVEIGEFRIWRNFTLLAKKLPGELRQLAMDAENWLAEPSRRFNRARVVPVNILIGKNGGTYQQHLPGLSFMMLPAYVLDRQIGGVQVGSEWPRRLWAVNSFSLTAYVVLAFLVLGLLRRLGYTRPVSFVAMLAVILTFPVAAFPFQFYPEVIAGVFVCLVTGYVCRPWKNVSSSFLAGAFAGYLPWLHVRFGGIALILAAAAGVALRNDARRLCGFAVGFGVVLACLSLYLYCITGSIVPTALWPADGGSVLSFSGMTRSAWAYLLDRDWGVLPYAPVLLLAAPGYWFLFRCQRQVAWLCVLLPAALIAPAAGYSVIPGASTPTRFIVAIVPLAAVPLAEILSRHGGRRIVQIGFGLLFMLSLDNALAYNLHHQKHYGPLVDWSFSGWKTNLLFPDAGRAPWDVSVTNGLLLTAWLAVLISLVTAPAVMQWLQARNAGRISIAGRRLHARAGAGMLVGAAVLVLLGTAVSGVINSRSHHRFRVPPRTAALEAAALLEEIEHCAVCLSTRRGDIGTKTVYEMLDDLGVPPRLCGASSIVRLQASNGQFVGARRRLVLADGEESGSSKRLKIIDPNGGCVESGDVVFLQTEAGFYLRPVGEARRISANGIRTGPWERFMIRARGGGVIRRRDTISLQTPTGNYVAAELGGGAPLYANRTQAGPWERFTLTALD